MSVSFGPLEVGSEINTFTVLLATEARGAHNNRTEVNVAVLDESGASVGEATVLLSYGGRATATVIVGAGRSRLAHLRFVAGFAEFQEGSVYGTVEIHYVLAYHMNPLAEIMNAAGSDKGTEVCVGSGGVPHCYALDYHRLFESFRNEHFSLLEIGLDNQDPPADAPSLRAWREYFPNATIYGYDIHDFGFFSQPDTFTFQGDQASRDELTRFLDAHNNPRFRLVVDDGSHASSHQQISLATLFPQVEPHGLYVIEDLNWQPFPESPTTRDVLRHFTETGGFETPFLSDGERHELEEAIAAVEFYKPNDSEFCLIRKRESHGRS